MPIKSHQCNYTIIILPRITSRDRKLRNAKDEKKNLSLEEHNNCLSNTNLPSWKHTCKQTHFKDKEDYVMEKNRPLIWKQSRWIIWEDMEGEKERKNYIYIKISILKTKK